MVESDKDFVERMFGYIKLRTNDFNRLKAIASRGADAADEIERLRASLREIAKVTYGWEPGVWSDKEAYEYFASLFFGAQAKARAALKEKIDE